MKSIIVMSVSCSVCVLIPVFPNTVRRKPTVSPLLFRPFSQTGVTTLRNSPDKIGVPDDINKFVDLYGLVFSLHADIVKFPGYDLVSHKSVGIFADDDIGLILFVRTFQTGPEIHVVTDQGIIHALHGSHISYGHTTGIDTDTYIEGNIHRKILVEIPKCLYLFDGAFARPQRVVLLGQWGSPETHYGIALVLVEGSLVLENDIGHGGKVFVEYLDKFLGGHALGNRRESANIRKEHRNI